MLAIPTHVYSTVHTLTILITMGIILIIMEPSRCFLSWPHILLLILMLARCCVHTRDFKVGDPIPDQILASVEQSRRTVIVLSKEYTQATWTRAEFTAAHQR